MVSSLESMGIVGLRVLASMAVVWYAAGATKKARFFSGLLTGAVSGALSFAFLEPLFSTVGMPIAMAALYILCIMAAAVGMCLGVLLPIFLPGVNFGVSSAILLAFFSNLVMKGNTGYTLTALALLGGLISAKAHATMLMLATSLEAGAIAGSLLNPNLFFCIASITRGQLFEPLPHGKAYEFIIPADSQMYLGLSWIILSMVTFVTIVYRQLQCQKALEFYSNNVCMNSTFL